jgi:hypothetical protein
MVKPFDSGGFNCLKKLSLKAALFGISFNFNTKKS